MAVAPEGLGHGARVLSALVGAARPAMSRAWHRTGRRGPLSSRTWLVPGTRHVLRRRDEWEPRVAKLRDIGGRAGSSRVRSPCGPRPSYGTPRRLLPRVFARRRSHRDLPRRRRLPAVPPDAARRRPPVRLAALRVLPDAHPLPRRARDVSGQSFARNAPPEWALRALLQRAART